jgi:hypothetical protein
LVSKNREDVDCSRVVQIMNSWRPIVNAAVNITVS